MGFGFIIIIRILFVTCMVFIIGYIFGGFSKKTTLTTITKVAAILVIVLFIASNAIIMRNNYGHFRGKNHWNQCDTAYKQEKHP
jgi:low affinity Fe/Cu permease